MSQNAILKNTLTNRNHDTDTHHLDLYYCFLVPKNAAAFKSYLINTDVFLYCKCR